MGIPAYFRWISEKYPRIMVNCVEHVDRDHQTGEERAVDASTPNPNGVEFDNLYLDMNGIIHPCTHPEDRPAPTTEHQMFEAIFDYIDRIFAIVRPRRLLYMAVDGVAPRAKINQQRSRRFRAAQELQQKLNTERELREEWAKHNRLLEQHDPHKHDQQQHNHEQSQSQSQSQSHAHFDSNVITPGTPFMARLAVALRKYVANRIQHNPAWRQIAVVFSDASVPGEGEHKIAEFIRRERAHPQYDPNIRHVMYGLDADLIMLALATHEVHFTILREEVFTKRGNSRSNNNYNNNNNNNAASSSASNPKQIDSVVAQQAQQAGLQLRSTLGGKKPFHFLHVHILREYLEFEFKNDIISELQAARFPADIAFDLERVIDDFVFMCFFVGNDFLPHLPTLDIREGAIDYLIELYKTEVARIGYLTAAQGEIDFVRVRKLLQRTASKEDEVFKERLHRERLHAERNKEMQERDKRGTKRDCGGLRSGETGGSEPSVVSPSKRRALERKRKNQGYQEAFYNMRTVELGRKTGRVFGIGNGEANARAANALKARLERGNSQTDSKSGSSSTASGRGVKTESDLQSKDEGDQQKSVSADGSAQAAKKSKAEFEEALKQRLREKNELEVVDTIKLGEQGWKHRYYEQKFGWGPEQREEKQMLLCKYNEGLQWVMKYYYVGCMSWGWYYPYHYAPFASDLVESESTAADIKFELGEPFEPFTQLQAVMPASSGKLVLPRCYSELMVDAESPIIDYYPEEFEVDLNGKRFAWQGVVLLPFIDEKRLHSALRPLKDKLSEEERRRNRFGENYVMVHRDSALGRSRRCAGEQQQGSCDEAEMKRIDSDVANGLLFGTASYALGEFGGGDGAVITVKFEVPDKRDLEVWVGLLGS
ncbi:5'-3' exoribonuclease 2 [Gracilariopsis chorda]|uniref:5'-3' exoribonuclease n=1 Tax=Gracilariopsis chorda TaxID=448386 RepID=A0A2V3IPF9_9FLOR|nr:5'-3' exoribonuclease 2 [Gracilariopsis chorda]|eukprot:PXF43962.1 5'-3' exoribonuclease 2 [Gracilariopsis chorda]